MRMLWTPLLVLALASNALAADVDTDKDGLSDFLERHKYFSDPAKADTDGDGTPDGAWDERREHAYTIRSVVRVMRPVSQDLDDDYQDVRVLEETPTWVKLEVIHYPLNTVASAIRADATWRDTAKTMKDVTSPGVTANFDHEMVRDLRELLKADGIDVDALDDKTLVERASKWLIGHTKEESLAFTGYFTHFPDGKPAIHPGCERGMGAYNRGKFEPAEQWQRDLFAKGMFAGRTRGSCTSSAIYLTGGLRAIGLPTRIVYCIPVIDPTDEDEVAMLRGLRHPEVRETLLEALGDKGGWFGHTFNEVYVGGRWRRLNYDTLGENIYGRHVFGLMTHVLTVNDWADAKSARTIGVRQSVGRYDDIFGHRNPYSTVELSDRFGVHMKHRPKRTPEGATQDLGSLTEPTWSDSAAGKALVGRTGFEAFAILARVADYSGSFRALRAYQAAGSGRIWLEPVPTADKPLPEDAQPFPLDVGSGGLTRGGKAWVILTLPKHAVRAGVQYRLRAEDDKHWRIQGTLPSR